MGEGSSKTKFARFLLQYRNAPQGTTGQSPAELLMGRRLRSHPDLVHQNLSQRVQRRQRCQTEQHDQHARERSIEIGDRVNSRNFSGKPVWLSGVVTESSDENNCVIRRHQDHIRGETDRDDVSNPPDVEQCAVHDPAHPFELPPAPLPEPPQIHTPSQVVTAEEATTVKSPVRDTPSQVVTAGEATTVKSPVRDVPKSVERRYPTLDRRPPVYYKDCN